MKAYARALCATCAVVVRFALGDCVSGESNREHFDTRGIETASLGDVAIHYGGELAGNESWDSNRVHVVYGTLRVPEGVTLEIAPGTLVEFVGGGLDVAGVCMANGVTFTDIRAADGTAVPSYSIRGNVTADADTRIVCNRDFGGGVPAGTSERGKLLLSDRDYRFADSPEMIAYSTEWDEGSRVRVTMTDAEGGVTELVDATAPISDALQWFPPRSGVYDMRLTTDKTELHGVYYYIENAEVHFSAVSGSNEVWTADRVHVVEGNVCVMPGARLTIEPGAVVKCMPQSYFEVRDGGTCIANGVVFTHISDDSIGGDSFADGVQTIAENEFRISGNIVDDEITEYRHAVKYLNGTLTENATWVPERVYVIGGELSVPAGVTLTIQKGTVVKFADGGALTVANGGTCDACGVVFTHLADDTAGGDTNGDDSATKPVFGAYTITGSITDDDTTDYRYAAPIEVGGTLKSDATWFGRSLIHVTSSLTVQSGVTLTIEPGTIVKIANGAQISVSGVLNANGTRAQPVVFTSVADDGWGGDTNGDGGDSQPNPGDWNRIIVYGRASFEYAQVLYVSATANYGGIEASGGVVDFNNSTIAHTQYECVNAHNGGTFTARNSVFWDSSLGFGYYGSGKVAAYNCVFADMTVAVRQSGKILRNCVFYKCSEDFVDQSGVNSSFENCLFFNPAGCGVQEFSKCGNDGNVWADPLFIDADKGDFRVADNSPCLDAGNTTFAPDRDYYGQPRVGESADIGIYEIMPRYVSSDVDLSVRDVLVPDGVEVGGKLSVRWTIDNLGSETAVGSRRDIVELIDVNGVVHQLGEYIETKSVPAGGSLSFGTEFDVPAVAVGKARVRITANAYRDVFEGSLTANNRATAMEKVSVYLPKMKTSTDMSLKGGRSVAFAVPAEYSASAIRITAQGGDAVVLGGVGYTPTGMRFDVKSVRLDDGSSLLLMPEGVSGDFVVSVANEGQSSIVLRMEEASEELLERKVPDRPSAGSSGTGHIVAKLSIPENVRMWREYTGTIEFANDGDGEALAPYFRLVSPGISLRLRGASAWSHEELEVVGIADGEPAGVIRPGETFRIDFDFRPEDGTRIVLESADDEREEWRSTITGVSNAATILGRRGLQIRDWSELLRYADMFAEGGDVSAVSGSLCDSRSGQPLVGAEIGAFDIDDKLLGSAKVLENGVFSVEGLPNGADILLRVLSGGFADALVVTTPQDGDLNGVRWLGSKGAVINFTLIGVTDSDLKKGASIEVSGFDLNAPRLVRLTSCDSASIEVPAGNVYLYTAYLRSGWSVMGSAVFEAGESETSAVIDFTKGARVSGRVVDAAGKSVADASVELSADAYGNVSYQTRTDVDGAFCFGCLPQGDFTVRVSAEGFGDPAARAVSVPKEGEVQVGDIEMVGFSSSLQVMIANAPLDGTVRVVTEGGFTSAAIEIPSNGVVDFVGVPDGVCKVAVFDDSGRCVHVADDILLHEGGNRLEITVSQPMCVVYCKAKDAAGALIPATWSFTSVSGDGATLATATHGALACLRASTYDIKVSAPGYKTCQFRSEITANKSIDATLKPDPDFVEKLERQYEAMPSASEMAGPVVGMTIGGHVTGGTKSRYEGGHVIFQGNRGNPRVVTELSADGTFRCAGVPDDATEVWVDLPDGSLFMTARSVAETNDWVIPIPDDLYEVLVVALDKDGKPVVNHEFKFVNTRTLVTQVRRTNSKGHAVTKQKSGEKVTVNGKEYTAKPDSQPVCPTCRHRPCVCESEREDLGDEHCPDCGKKSCICNIPKDNEIKLDPNGSGNDDDGNGEYTEVEIDQEELEALLDFFDDFADIPNWWGILNLSWYEQYLKKLHSFSRRLDSLDKEKLDPNYATCIAKNCDYNDRVWARYVACCAEARAAINEASLALEYAHMRGRELTGSIAADGFAAGAAVASGGGAIAMLGKTSNYYLTMIQHVCNVATLAMQGAQGDWGSFGLTGLGEAFSLSAANAAVLARVLANECSALNTAFNKTSDSAYSQLKDLVLDMSCLVNNAGRLTSKAVSAANTPYKECSATDPMRKKEDEKNTNETFSLDPNELLGPVGEGDPKTERFMRPGEWMTYTVYFENSSNATAGAQEVYVTNPLSEWLDLDSFEMGEVAYANQSDLGLVGLQNGVSEADLSGTAYRVQSNVMLDKGLSTVGWYLRIVDPTTVTGWPEDPFAGFLMPNDETHRGEGHLTYRIRVREDAPRNVVITNTASIVFDYNEAIETDPFWWNTAGWPLTLGEAVNNEALDWSTGGAMDWLPMWDDCAADELHDAVVSGVGNNTNAWVKTIVDGPGTVSFAWCGALASRNTKMQFLVDGTVEAILSGSNDWERINVTVYGEGEHALMWRLQTGRSGASADDFSAIDCVEWIPAVPPTLEEALNPDLAWSIDGDADWHGVAKDSIVSTRESWAAVSGLGDEECAGIETRVYGSGLLCFDWAVSCEEVYDELVLFVDGKPCKSISGECGWKTDAMTIEGKCWHTVRWEYVKDEMDEPELVGDNRAMLDNVVWVSVDEPPRNTESTPVPVPFAEIDAKYKSYLDAANGDYEAAALAVGKNGYAIWECYVAGLDPDDPESKFRITDIKFEDGELKVTWSPDLKDARKYTEFGRKELGGTEEWTDMKDVNPAEKNDYKFRKVTVDIP